MKRLVLLLALTAAAGEAALSVKVYSEFRRPDGWGDILPTDRGGTPREILSPAMVRNAWHSYWVVVEAPRGKDYTLYLSQNPERRFRMNLYRPGEGRLEPVKLPASVRAAGFDAYLLDVFVAADIPYGRVRVELQVNQGDDWVIYPMEVRVFGAVVPVHGGKDVRLPGANEAAVEVARRTLAEYVCGTALPKGPAAEGWTAIVRRNALQDRALAEYVASKQGRDKVIAKMMTEAGVPSVAAFCGGGRIASANGPEWYLRIRDYLFREGSH